MAKNKSTVYLGFEDEEVSAKHTLNSTVNKVGGFADWPNGDIKVPACPLCSTPRPLIVQLYAPLEQSQFHRTLYVFACLNPVCSQNSRSWLCVRTQHLDMPQQAAADLISAVPPPLTAGSRKKREKEKQSNAKQKLNWCSGADDWGEVDGGSEDMDTEADDFQQQNEENGNVIAAAGAGAGGGAANVLAPLSFGAEDDEDDDDDESNSMENDIIFGFTQLDVHSPQGANEDPNANCAAGAAAAAAGGDGVHLGVGGIAGGSSGATATICAEIEGAETDVVLVETPMKPERDLIALLKHTASPAALGPLSKITDVTLKSFFIAVDVEARQRQSEADNYVGLLSADHIRELYQDYKRQDEAAHSPNSGTAGSSGGVAAANGASVADEQEAYEKVLPAHGDLIFHQFMNILQQNPGQLLRYSRDTLPLLIAPLAEAVPKCQHCGHHTICEAQILSTLIPRLRLQQNNIAAPLEYGNVLVFTCSKSCWDTPDKMRYERVIVQTEQ